MLLNKFNNERHWIHYCYKIIRTRVVHSLFEKNGSTGRIEDMDTTLKVVWRVGNSQIAREIINDLSNLDSQVPKVRQFNSQLKVIKNNYTHDKVKAMRGEGIQ